MCVADAPGEHGCATWCAQTSADNVAIGLCLALQFFGCYREINPKSELSEVNLAAERGETCDVRHDVIERWVVIVFPMALQADAVDGNAARFHAAHQRVDGIGFWIETLGGVIVVEQERIGIGGVGALEGEINILRADDVEPREVRKAPLSSKASLTTSRRRRGLYDGA